MNGSVMSKTIYVVLEGEWDHFHRGAFTDPEAATTYAASGDERFIEERELFDALPTPTLHLALVDEWNEDDEGRMAHVVAAKERVTTHYVAPGLDEPPCAEPVNTSMTAYSSQGHVRVMVVTHGTDFDGVRTTHAERVDAVGADMATIVDGVRRADAEREALYAARAAATAGHSDPGTGS